MTLTIRAHFDGKVFIPEGPVQLAKDEPVTLTVATEPQPVEPLPDMETRKAAYQRLLEGARQVNAGPIPDEALRRDNIYRVRR